MSHPGATRDTPDHAQHVVLASADCAWIERLTRLSKRHPSPFNLHVCSDPGCDHPWHASPSALWLVDEGWLARVPDDAARKLLVHFVHLDAGPLLDAFERGIRGCLAFDAGDEEILHALAAVARGEVWLGRKQCAQLLARVAHPSPIAPRAVQKVLTQRQCQIVDGVARGLTNKQIGRKLAISPTTVKTHLHQIFERTGVAGRTLLARQAAALGAGDDDGPAKAPPPK